VRDLPDLGVRPFEKCNTAEVKGHRSRYWSIANSVTITCEEGDLYDGWVAFWVPEGGKTMYAGLERGECTGNEDEVWSGLQVWQALPADL
jgi:hypothetical protein